jgi:nucleotide-binding universal stress UspA family protein
MVSNRSLVLVAVDGARDARSTAEFAVGIAKGRDADLRAVQVQARVAGRLVEPPNDPGLRAALRALRRAGEREGVRISHITLAGAPERVIPAYAQLTGAAVVVVGRTYGTSNFWRNTRVVRRLSRSAPVPVIVVPRRRSALDVGPLSLKRIVAAVDFTVASAVALRTAVGLARAHGARLTAVHAMGVPGPVYSGGEAWRVLQQLPAEARLLAERLKGQAFAIGSNDVDPVVVTGEAATVITQKAADSAADLIVMGVAPRTWLDEVVFGSTLRAVLRKAKIPVLVLPVAAGAHKWTGGLRKAAPISASGRTFPQLAA